MSLTSEIILEEEEETPDDSVAALDTTRHRRNAPNGQGSNSSHPLIDRITVVSVSEQVDKLNNQVHTVYNIKVHAFGNREWLVGRRYQHFFDLHTKFSQIDDLESLPKLPPKQVFGTRAAKFITKRRQQLQRYLENLLAHPQLAQNSYFLSFIQAEQLERTTADDDKLTSFDYTFRSGGFALFGNGSPSSRRGSAMTEGNDSERNNTGGNWSCVLI